MISRNYFDHIGTLNKKENENNKYLTYQLKCHYTVRTYDQNLPVGTFVIPGKSTKVRLST